MPGLGGNSRNLSSNDLNSPNGMFTNCASQRSSCALCSVELYPQVSSIASGTGFVTPDSTGEDDYEAEGDVIF